MSAPPPRRAYVLAALLSSVCFGWETLLQRYLVFAGGQLAASATLPAAVVGLGVGAALAARFGPGALRVGALAFAPAVGAACASVLHATDPLSFVGLVALTLPFVAVGLTVGAVLERWPSPRVYAADLAGASLAIGLLVGSLPVLHDEGAAVLVFAGALAVPALVGELPRIVRGVALGAAVVVGVQAHALPFNLGRDVPSFLADDLRLVRCRPCTWVDTATSIVGRIDLYAGEPHYTFHLANGFLIDTMRPWPASVYQRDPRVPTPFLPPEPRIYVVGTAGEGILKTATRLGGEVRGVEANPATVALLRGRAAARCGDCYAGVDVTIGDARAALRAAGTGWDLVTYLNTHANQGRTGRAVAPEFLDTTTSVHLTWRALAPTGLMTWEEPELVTPPAALTRLTSTVLQVLRDEGVAEPTRHLLVYTWGAYVQLVVRKTPWTEDEVTRWLTWTDDLTHAEGGVNGPFGEGFFKPTAVTTPVFPVNRSVHYAWMYDWLRTGAPPSDRLAEDFAPLTDDRPFLFSTPTTRAEVRDAIRGQVALTLTPLGLALGLAWRDRRPVRVATLAAGALSGFVFLGVETLLLTQGQVVFGSPSGCFVVVLGGMLLASGVVSTFGGAGARGLLLGAAALALAATRLVPVAEASAVPAWVGGAWAVALGGTLGAAFPRLLTRAGAEGQAALFFAVNAAAAALAGPFVTLLALQVGFSAVWVVLAAGALLLARLVG